MSSSSYLKGSETEILKGEEILGFTKVQWLGVMEMRPGKTTEIFCRQQLIEI